MATFPTYCDCVDFLNNSDAAIETNSLIGGNATLSTAYPAGSTALVVNAVTSPITYATSAFIAGPAYILDGLLSETVTITSNSPTGTLNLASGTLVAHGAGVNIVSAGTSGNLARALVDASRRVETFCRQGPAGTTGVSNAAITTLSGSYSIGATSLTLSSGTNAVAGFARIIDGASSELVNVTIVSGATITIAAPGLVFAHTSLTTIQTGVASDRNLYAQPRAETYTLATMLNHVDSDGTLVLHPYHFPVVASSSILLQIGTLTGLGVSFTGLVYPNGGRMIMIPYASWASGNPTNQWIPNVRLRDPNLWVQMTYNAGPIPLAVGSTPQLALVADDLKRATYLYAMATLGLARSNPLGVASLRQGDIQRQYELRGNQKQQANMLIKDAEDILEPYRR